MIIGSIKRRILSWTNLPTKHSRRISQISNSKRMALSKFLSESKQQYLDAVKEGKGHEWIVVMGNEAGDLDSVASSIAYAWFTSTVQKTPAVALLQTPRGDLNLRPENTHAFALAELSPSHDELLCIDDIPQSHSTSPSFPSNRFALVDHNRLLPQFAAQSPDAHETVVAVLDHHDDEGLYRESADPRRIVVPTGSAASIVARHIEEHSAGTRILKEIARLLLCAILVDTAGLMPGGKAEELDRSAAAYLLAHAELGASLGAGESSLIETDEASMIIGLTSEILEKKSDVARLGTTDLLRRDYKQYAYAYTYAGGPGGGGETVRVGLSTVPVDLRIWLARGSMHDFWTEVDSFMDGRGLDVLGVLTTFSKEKHGKKHEKKHGKKHGDEDAGESEREKKKGKHRRQILLVMRDAPASSTKNRGLEARLLGGMEGAPELALEERSLVKFARKHHRKGDNNIGTIPDDAGVGDRRVKVYKQGNAKATRKVVAPLLKKIIEGDASGDGAATALN